MKEGYAIVFTAPSIEELGCTITIWENSASKKKKIGRSAILWHELEALEGEINRPIFDSTFLLFDFTFLILVPHFVFSESESYWRDLDSIPCRVPVRPSVKQSQQSHVPPMEYFLIFSLFTLLALILIRTFIFS